MFPEALKYADERLKVSIDALLKDHDVVRDQLLELERMGVEHPNFMARLRALVDYEERHSKEEELTVLPVLKHNCTPEQLHQLGALHTMMLMITSALS
jgi:hypothetical protein